MDDNQVVQKLQEKIDNEKILMSEPMSKHTSFRIGGPADILVKATTTLDMMYTIKVAKETNTPLTVIGNGSNILVRDHGIRGIVLKIMTNHIEIMPKDDYIYVIVDAGTPLGMLANTLASKGISGIEFASGIPGTIGGAIYMNAGAYGGEFKDIVEETVYFDLEESKIKLLSKEEHHFSYRHSLFQEKKAIIINTKLKLSQGNQKEIREKIIQDIQARKEKQPLEYPSAGSAFKRGKDFIAAKLIDECGLKGTTIGDAEVSTKHAGFIINKGNAKAEDVLKLIELIKKTVFEKTGKKIVLEIEVIGE